jgi:two-component system cell cycle sensor histidine kinase PleC
MKGELLGALRNGSYKEYAANIHYSGRHLLELINEVLDLSRIEAGRCELQEAPVNLAAVAEDCLRLLQLRAESKGLAVSLAAGKGLEPLWADERAIRQICLNLLSNAVKFTPRGGQIVLTVSATPDGGQTLTVKDTGPGIPRSEIPKVLQAFGQGSLAHETGEGGTGLGLPIVQSLVALHGGEFNLHSELRKGTEAIVRLPSSRRMSARPEIAQDGCGHAARPESSPWWRLYPAEEAPPGAHVASQAGLHVASHAPLLAPRHATTDC